MEIIFEVYHTSDFLVLELGWSLVRPPGPISRRTYAGPHFLLDIGPDGRTSSRLCSKTIKFETLNTSNMFCSLPAVRQEDKTLWSQSSRLLGRPGSSWGLAQPCQRPRNCQKDIKDQKKYDKGKGGGRGSPKGKGKGKKR